MNNRQYILLGPRGKFLINKVKVVDIKENGKNLVDILQTKNCIEKDLFVNPYCYIVKKKKPKLIDILLQELLKIREFYRFNNHSYLYVDLGLEDLNAATYYFRNETWKHLKIDAKYNTRQYIDCLNMLKESWFQEINGK